MKTAPAALLLAALVLAPARLAAQAPDPAGVEFFERKVRPVLVQHCYRCHSEEAQKNKKLKADLFLDSRTGVRKGGESGPAVVPGKSKDSLLLKALRHETVQMPPGKKLPDDVVADFARWIDMGAPDPRDGKAVVAAKREIDVGEGRKFWSFRPLQAAAPPQVKNEAWVRNPIDRFILAKQEEKGLVPNGPASREKLLRRAYYDLLGLPPTPEEVEEFLRDTAPDAYERLIDRLLCSPHYGERWARHWLDVARFAESGGYEFDGDRPGAYHYRDFVIRALNDDMPHDQFVRLQLAGDKLAPGDYHAGAATGFLVAGPYPGQTTARTIERIRYDQLDDMMATAGSAMLGLTLACARCHDHKYDPLPQQDYYKLIAAVGRTTFTNVNLDPEPEVYRKAKAEFDRAHAPLVAALAKFEKEELPGRLAKWKEAELPKLPAPRWLLLDPVSAKGKATLQRKDDGSVLATGKINPGDAYTLVAHTHQRKITGIRLEALADKALPGGGPGLNKDGSFILTELTVTAAPLDAKNKTKPVPVKLRAAKATQEQAGRPLASALDRDKKNGWGVNQAGKDQAAVFEVEGDVGFEGGTALTFVLKFDAGLGIGRPRLAITTAAPPAALDGTAAMQHAQELRTLLEAKRTDNLLRWFRRFDARADELAWAVEEHARKEPRPNLATVFAAGPGGGDVFFLVRGEVDRKQGKAAPGFLQVLTAAAEKDERWLGKAAPDPRVGLGKWMTDTEHGAGHLLARVIVNRLWKHHFGKGIVATPNDFGAQGERPTHPELLDWMASELIRGGWRLKAMHKLIMTTAAYRQAGEVSPDNQRIDPDNKLLWHRPPRRLEAEAIRDALLAVSGTLDRRMYGPGTLDENNPRRSIYLTVKRSRLVPFLQMFDAPEPIQSIGERSSTTVATQALAMMNSPLVRQRAEKLAQRVRPAAGEPLDVAVERAYLHALSRRPTAAERDGMVSFLSEQERTGLPRDRALAEMCQVVLCLNEFVYVD